jgi:hypothetical protein
VNSEYAPTRQQLVGQLAYAIAEGKEVEAASLRREMAALDAKPVDLPTFTRGMKWPWQRAPENRGTLTLFPNGQVVLGMPHGSTDRMTAETAAALRDYIQVGWTQSGTLVFPFPIDVVDRR